MEKRAGWRCAGAVMAAVAGTGYASGRELVLFFAQLGWASWAGIAFASVVFGLLVALLCRCAARGGAATLLGVCRGLLGAKAIGPATALYALLLALTAAVMLCGAGEAGALTLPVRHGFLTGAALALLIAALLNLNGQKGLPWAGLAALGLGLAFYAALALDGRSPRVYLPGDTALALEGSLPAAALLALAYAAMNACLAAGAAARFGRTQRDHARLGALCAALLCALLSAANGAILRGGRQLLSQALPTVILAARWGAAGFWCSAGFGFLCATTTLAAVLGGIVDLLRGGQRRWVWVALLVATALCAALGLPRIVGSGYPVLGWACAAGMLALAGRCARRGC